jgi:hypothetical protein
VKQESASETSIVVGDHPTVDKLPSWFGKDLDSIQTQIPRILKEFATIPFVFNQVSLFF